MKRQRNMAQMKQQNKTPEQELNKMKVYNLSDAEFQTLVIRILKEHTGCFNCIKKTQAEIKVTLSEIKKNLLEIDSGVMKLRISSMIWNIRNKKTSNQNSKKKKESKKYKDRLRSLRDNFKSTNIEVIAVLEGEEKARN